MPPNLASLLESWELALRAERKAPMTIKSYLAGVNRYLHWCDTTGIPANLDRRNVARFVAGLLDGGAEPATARARQLALIDQPRRETAECELPTDPLLGIRPPKLDTKIVEPLSTDELTRLIRVCQGRDFIDRRDEAIIRLMTETGCRAGEVVALGLADLDLPNGTATVRRGKEGGRGRSVPFGTQTTRSLDRYVRVRRSHRLAATSPLWLGDRGKTLGYDGLYSALSARATAANIAGFHPHKLRHTAAHRWLAAGGSEGGLMAVAGWTRPDMLIRYTSARASDRAAAEARMLDLGNVG